MSSLSHRTFFRAVGVLGVIEGFLLLAGKDGLISAHRAMSIAVFLVTMMLLLLAAGFIAERRGR